MNVRPPSKPPEPAMPDAKTGLMPTRYLAFDDIRNVLTELKLAAKQAHSEYGNATAEALLDARPSRQAENFALNALVKRLESYGFKRTQKAVLAGGNAIVLIGHDHNFIRIVSDRAKEDERSKEPFILQPIVHEHITLPRGGGFRVEVLPEVTLLSDVLADSDRAATLGMRGDVYAHARELIGQLSATAYQRGMFLFDISANNIGVLKGANGQPVPVVVDAGAVVSIEKAENYHWHNFERRVQNAKLYPDFPGAVDIRKPLTVAHELDDFALSFGQTPPPGELEKIRAAREAQEAEEQRVLRANAHSYWEKLRAEPAPKLAVYAQAQAAFREGQEMVLGEVKNAMTPGRRSAALRKYAENRQYPNERTNADGSKEPLEKRTPLQAEYKPENSLGHALLREGVTPSELKYMGGRAQRDEQLRLDAMTDQQREAYHNAPDRKGFCEKLKQVAEQTVDVTGRGGR